MFNFNLQYGGAQPDSLQVLNVTSITNDECERRVFRPIHQSILCTLNLGGQGICDVSNNLTKSLNLF